MDRLEEPCLILSQTMANTNNVIIVKLEKVLLDVILLNCGKLNVEVMSSRSIFQL